MGLDPDVDATSVIHQTTSLPVIPAKLEDADLPNQHFDAVAMTHVIEHLFDPIGAIQYIQNQRSEKGQTRRVSGDKDRAKNNFPISGDRGHGPVVPFGEEVIEEDLHVFLETLGVLPARLIDPIEHPD